MAKMNPKVIRSLSKLMEAGFDSEKAILTMTMDDILSLPGISVAEIGRKGRKGEGRIGGILWQRRNMT